MKNEMKRSASSRRSKHEVLEAPFKPEHFGASYWHERLLEYLPAYTDLSTMVTVLMRIEPQFRHAQAYAQLGKAVKGKGTTELLRLTVQTIRRHIAANPAVESDYKTQLRAGMQGFTGKVKVFEPGPKDVEIQALRATLTKSTQRQNPTR